MGNKTFMPAFQCNVGNWKYYICMMKYGEVARQVNFAYELGKNDELGKLIQRGLSSRTKDITNYLLTSPHRFLGGMVVAAWGGEPQYTRLAMDDSDGMLQGLDREFGVLTFDGTQQYFALDGQHRLKAIKEALKQNPDIGKEDICVLIVTHYDNPEGRRHTRRLFSNINRNAKAMGAAENIALDEDDAFAILARRMIEDHPFLSQEGRVKVIVSQGDEGELNLAKQNISKTDPKALTTLTVLYDLLQHLGGDLGAALKNRKVRPSDDELESAYAKLQSRLDDLLTHCGDIRSLMEGADSARELRSPKDREDSGHPFMRPIIQKSVAKVALRCHVERRVPWATVMNRLSEMDWRIGVAPWTAVYATDGAKMLSGKEHSVLLQNLLYAHIAPTAKSQITQALRDFKSIRGTKYTVPEEVLVAKIVHIDDSTAPPVIDSPSELSGDSDV